MSASSPRVARRRVDGVLLLDKPAGVTSNVALQRARRLYAAEKAGHTGTLDPLATGLLPLCFGEATKFAQATLDARKEYVATVHFGVATTTGDAEGDVVARVPVTLTREALAAALPRFIGRIAQTPPAFAALKVGGRKYYEYARKGIALERQPRDIAVDTLDIIDWQPPCAVLRVGCSKGTYVRVLAEDIGRGLGSCAHLAALRRTASGPFAIEQAVTFEELEALDADGRDRLLLPADATLAQLSRLDVDAPTARSLVAGRLTGAPSEPAGRYRCYDGCGRFIGLVESVEGRLRALRLMRIDAA
jgi:tRNA pseudouridine55 synthase